MKVLASRPPKPLKWHYFSRKPRSLNEVTNYIATELFNCFFYYLRYSLVGILPTRIVKHFEKNSTAVYILCKAKIEYSEIRAASDLLKEFVEDFNGIYGQGAVTMNLHILIHYHDVIIQCGPLWSYSMFGFESNLGRLKQLVSGQTDVLLQIAEKFVASLHEPECDNEEKIPPNIKMSQKTTIEIKPEYSSILAESGNISLEQDSINIWRRCEIKGRLYTSINTTATKSADFFVKISNGIIGKIEFFFGNEASPKLLLHVFRITFESYHLFEVEETTTFKTFECREIAEKLLYLEADRIKYITREPNIFGRGTCLIE